VKIRNAIDNRKAVVVVGKESRYRTVVMTRWKTVVVVVVVKECDRRGGNMVEDGGRGVIGPYVCFRLSLYHWAYKSVEVGTRSSLVDCSLCGSVA